MGRHKCVDAYSNTLYTYAENNNNFFSKIILSCNTIMQKSEPLNYITTINYINNECNALFVLKQICILYCKMYNHNLERI